MKPWRHATESKHARGYGAAWLRLREVILTRDKGLCCQCLKEGRVSPAFAVDHIVNKSVGGTDDESNLQSLCKPCHATKTAGESVRARGGTPKVKVRIGLDGWPVG